MLSRLLPVGAPLAAALVLTPSPASAQFVCTVTAIESLCINSGTAAAAFPNIAGGVNQDATTINNGSAAGFSAVTIGGGNANASNSGSNTNGIDAQTLGGGNATVTNSGSTTGLVQLIALGGGTSSLTLPQTQNMKIYVR